MRNRTFIVAFAIAALCSCDDKEQASASSPNTSSGTTAQAAAETPPAKPMSKEEWYAKACPMVANIIAKNRKRGVEIKDPAKLDEVCESRITGNTALLLNSMAISCGRAMTWTEGPGHPPGGTNFKLQNTREIPPPLQKVKPREYKGEELDVVKALGKQLDNITDGTNKPGGINDGMNTLFQLETPFRVTYQTGSGRYANATCTVRAEGYVNPEGTKVKVIEKVMTFDEETGGAIGQLKEDGEPITIFGRPDDPEPESTSFRKIDEDERQAVKNNTLKEQELRRQIEAQLYDRKQEVEKEEIPVSENPRQLVTAIGRICLKYFDGRQEYTMGEDPEPWHGNGGIFGARVPANEKMFPGGLNQRYVSVSEVPQGDEIRPTEPSAKQFEKSTAELLENPFDKPRLYQYIYETGPEKGGGAVCKITAIADIDPSNPEMHTVSQVVRISPDTGKPIAEPIQELHEFK